MQVILVATGFKDVMQLVVALLVLVGILFATYYTTRWIGSSGVIQLKTGNLEVIETLRISQGKYIQIVRIGKKYYSVSNTKDEIRLLTSVELEELNLEKPELKNPPSFKEILKKVRK